jgi:regulator of sigma E protease
LVVTAVVFYRGVEVPSYQDQPPVVGAVAPDSPAARSDIRPGDRLLSVAGHTVRTWEAFFLAIGSRPNREVSIELLRTGRVLTRDVTPATQTGQGRLEFGDVGVFPDVHPRIHSVNPGEPGERGGLRAGDVIVAIDGEPMTFSSQLRAKIAERPEKVMRVSVRRGRVAETLAITPGRKGSIGWLGVLPMDETKSIKPGLLGALVMSGQRNLRDAGLIFQVVWGLITGETSPRALMGPLAIAQLSGESAQLGWINLLGLMAVISLNLGIINLLPIPILDGGHITIMALEGLTRRDFSLRVKEKILLAGFVVLMVLMVTVIYNDLTRVPWIERFMPWR